MEKKLPPTRVEGAKKAKNNWSACIQPLLPFSNGLSFHFICKRLILDILSNQILVLPIPASDQATNRLESQVPWNGRFHDRFMFIFFIFNQHLRTFLENSHTHSEWQNRISTLQTKINKLVNKDPLHRWGRIKPWKLLKCWWHGLKKLRKVVLFRTKEALSQIYQSLAHSIFRCFCCLQ